MEKYIPLIIILIIVIAVVCFIVMIFKKISRTVRTISDTVNTVSHTAKTIKEIANMADDIPTVPQQKTVGGATNVMLPRITADFPQFHNPDAQSDVEAVVRDYLMIIHGNKSDFNDNTVNKMAMGSIPKAQSGKVSNVIFHKTAIYNYQKTLDYATITYRTSVGYKLNDQQIETRFEIAYTLRLKEDGIATKNIICNNCGATLDNFYNDLSYTTTKNDGVCPYCGTKIIRDTIMSWLVSGIKEMP
jgi:DNA-directed RNA polymerase subunit RPC12/RpoP